jgi:hypothetical protein
MPDSTPEQITGDELEYHKKLIEQVKWANETRPRIERIEAAWKMWAEHLHEKYGLGMGDGVVETGEIVRTVQQELAQ